MDVVTNALRFSEDQNNVADCLLSQNQTAVYLYSVHNDQITFGQTDAGRVVSPRTRIVIADGYRAYAPLDGYLNPRVEQIDGGIIVLANGQLSRCDVLIGALCLPYTLGIFTGGFDPLAVFQPPAGSTNLQIYIVLSGLGFATSGNVFKIKHILLTGKDIQEGISFKIAAEATGMNVDLG